MNLDAAPSLNRRGIIAFSGAALCLIASATSAQSPVSSTIERVKSSIVAVGTFQPTRQPQYRFLGTGFAVGDGTLIATNVHVLAASSADGGGPETLAVLLPAREAAQRVIRHARQVAVANEQDLALLRIPGPSLPALSLGNSDSVHDGQEFLFTGFPVGEVLGLIPATHRAFVAAVTPVVLPVGQSGQLDGRVVRQVRAGSFDVFQLDAMAYPGSSGSPLYDPRSAEVVGVVNMGLIRSMKEAPLPQPTGISYAVPARHLRELLREVE